MKFNPSSFNCECLFVSSFIKKICSHNLPTSFVTQCLSYVVQLLTAAVEVGPLGSTGNDNRPRNWHYDPSSPNLLEFAATFHFSALESRPHSLDLLYTISFVHACHLCVINLLALFDQLKYRLIPTTIFGLIGISHFL